MNWSCRACAWFLLRAKGFSNNPGRGKSHKGQVRHRKGGNAAMYGGSLAGNDLLT
jgi:hypothetical protein